MSDAPANRSERYDRRDPAGRRQRNRLFAGACVSVAALAVCVLVVLVASVALRGAGRLDLAFLTGANSEAVAEDAGFGPAIVGSLCLMMICALAAIPLGVGTALLLEEYAPRKRLLRWFHGVVQANITNLAGVPSIVYGILGYTALATMFNAVGSPDTPGFSFGARYVAEYRDLSNQSVFVGLDNAQAALPPASAGLAYFADADLSERLATQVVTAEEIDPMRAELTGALDGVERRFRTALRAAQPDGQRGPVRVTRELAAQIAGELFDGLELQGDLTAYRELAQAQLMKMDGLSGLDLLPVRRALVNDLRDMEFAAAGARGVLEAGAEPQRRQVRAWYYFQAPFGRSVLTGGLTLALVVLPIVIVSSQEAIRAVPSSQRDAALALGGTQWQSIEQVVLPTAVPGICTGTILAMSRAIGEAAPILLLAFSFIQFTPVFREGGSLMDAFTAMPLQVFQWTSNPGDAFQSTTAAGILVLLAVLLSFNAVAVFLRYRFQGPR
ncbi:MAG: ABC transporter permease subunit [Planctomycetota bacterium]